MDDVEPYYQNQAKQFIDVLHDRGYFSEDIKREEMQHVEDLLAFLWDSHCKMAAKSVELLRRAKELKVSRDEKAEADYQNDLARAGGRAKETETDADHS